MAYLLAGIVVFFSQTRLIFPGAASQGAPQAVVRPGVNEQLVRLTAADGQPVVALYGPALDAQGRPRPDADRLPTILYFYGNGMCANDCWGEFDDFRRRGANVLVPDYLGYGMSGGKPSEAGCYATADAAYDYLVNQRQVAPGRLVAVGRSLGTGVAVDLASRRPVAAVATFSAFTSMDDMASRLLPFLPTSLLLRHHFDNRHKLAAVRVPLFVAHGTADRVVPFSMAAGVAAAAAGPVTRHDVAGGDHNDLFEVGGPALLDHFQAFLDSVVPSNGLGARPGGL